MFVWEAIGHHCWTLCFNARKLNASAATISDVILLLPACFSQWCLDTSISPRYPHAVHPVWLASHSCEIWLWCSFFCAWFDSILPPPGHIARHRRCYASPSVFYMAVACPLRAQPGGAASSASSGSNAIVCAISGNQPRIASLITALCACLPGWLIAMLLYASGSAAAHAGVTIAMPLCASGVTIGSSTVASVPAANATIAMLLHASGSSTAVSCANATIATLLHASGSSTAVSCALAAACPCATALCALAAVSLSVATAGNARAWHVAAGHRAVCTTATVADARVWPSAADH